MSLGGEPKWGGVEALAVGGEAIWVGAEARRDSGEARRGGGVSFWCGVGAWSIGPKVWLTFDRARGALAPDEGLEGAAGESCCAVIAAPLACRRLA